MFFFVSDLEIFNLILPRHVLATDFILFWVAIMFDRPFLLQTHVSNDRNSFLQVFLKLKNENKRINNCQVFIEEFYFSGLNVAYTKIPFFTKRKNG
jgi:hypothetical protein